MNTEYKKGFDLAQRTVVSIKDTTHAKEVAKILLKERMNHSLAFRLGFETAKETIETKFSCGDLTLYYLNELYIKCNKDIESYTKHKDLNIIESINGFQTAIEYGVALFNSRPEYATRNLTVFDI